MTDEMGALFSAEERARLEAMRDRLLRLPANVEMDLDEQRLLFARWLVENGKLSDEC